MYPAIVRAARRCVVRLIHQHRCGTSVANCCHLRAGCCRTVRMGWCKTSGKVDTRLRFKLRGRSAPPCAQCCARMRIRCTRLSIPAATRMHSRCANVQTTAVSWLQRKSWHCGDGRKVEVLLAVEDGRRCSGLTATGVGRHRLAELKGRARAVGSTGVQLSASFWNCLLVEANVRSDAAP